MTPLNSRSQPCSFRAGLISTVSRIERENTRRFEILGVSRGDDLAPSPQNIRFKLHDRDDRQEHEMARHGRRPCADPRVPPRVISIFHKSNLPKNGNHAFGGDVIDYLAFFVEVIEVHDRR